MGCFLFWRRRRDLNPRAGYPTYSLSRGAPSPLGYFCMVNLILQYIIRSLNPSLTFGGESGIRTHGALRHDGFQDRSVMTTSVSLRIVQKLYYHIKAPMSSINNLFSSLILLLLSAFFIIFFQQSVLAFFCPVFFQK